MGAEGIRSALLSSPKTAWLIAWPALTNFILESVSNYFANKGLIVLNIGAIYVEGELSQNQLDKSIDNYLKYIQLGKELTPQQIREIDNEVIRAARNFIPYTRPNQLPKP